MKCYVLGFFLTRSGAILIRKTRPEWQKGKWNGVGGAIEEGETAVEAMVREFEEEAGIITVAADWTEHFTLTGEADTPWQMTIFSAFGDLAQPFYPREIEEGTVVHSINYPTPMDSTADWLLRMCRDLYSHRMNIACSHIQQSGLLHPFTKQPLRPIPRTDYAQE